MFTSLQNFTTKTDIYNISYKNNAIVYHSTNCKAMNPSCAQAGQMGGTAGGSCSSGKSAPDSYRMWAAQECFCTKMAFTQNS